MDVNKVKIEFYNSFHNERLVRGSIVLTKDKTSLVIYVDQNKSLIKNISASKNTLVSKAFDIFAKIAEKPRLLETTDDVPGYSITFNNKEKESRFFDCSFTQNKMTKELKILKTLFGNDLDSIDVFR